ncbi:MAG TPA: AraC family transcriptional regulator [Fusobacterium sp.]|uniref:AraC family transcriptional regulator n=1 Tax=Fusobacterium sp. TaxID=68766 RepID=UPI002F3E2277
MSYLLKEITMRTNNTVEGIQKIEELWQDVNSGKLPLLFDSKGLFSQGIFPISRYSNYESDENGEYDFSILGVNTEFFQELELRVKEGKYKKYEFLGDSIETCTKNAWEEVWKEQKEKTIERAYGIDYESTVPAEYSKDGKVHCYLYIAIDKNSSKVQI